MSNWKWQPVRLTCWAGDLQWGLNKSLDTTPTPTQTPRPALTVTESYAGHPTNDEADELVYGNEHVSAIFLKFQKAKKRHSTMSVYPRNFRWWCPCRRSDCPDSSSCVNGDVRERLMSARAFWHLAGSNGQSLIIYATPLQLRQPVTCSLRRVVSVRAWILHVYHEIHANSPSAVQFRPEKFCFVSGWGWGMISIHFNGHSK